MGDDKPITLFTEPRDPRKPPYWLRKATPEELAEHKRMLDVQRKLCGPDVPVVILAEPPDPE